MEFLFLPFQSVSISRWEKPSERSDNGNDTFRLMNSYRVGFHVGESRNYAGEWKSKLGGFAFSLRMRLRC